jgi:hypothetical protein
MTKTAYCVVHVDTKSDPPKILGAAIYSESAASLTGAICPGRFAFDIAQRSGPDYESASSALCAYLQEYSNVFGWVSRLLAAGRR